MEQFKRMWLGSHPLRMATLSGGRRALRASVPLTKKAALFEKRASVVSWPILRDYIYPFLRTMSIVAFHIARITILPLTALLIAILTQTKVGGVILIGMAAWLATKLALDDVIKETCSGSWWDVFKCTLAVLLG